MVDAGKLCSVLSIIESLVRRTFLYTALLACLISHCIRIQAVSIGQDKSNRTKTRDVVRVRHVDRLLYAVVSISQKLTSKRENPPSVATWIASHGT